MTFVGKVLVVVQVILSLCFMAFAGAVYTVQQDWKSAHEKRVAELAEKEKLLQEKNEQIDFLNRDLAATQAIELNIQAYIDGLPDADVTPLAQLSEDERIQARLRKLATRARQAEADASRLTMALNAATTERDKINDELAQQKLENEKAEIESRERAKEAEIFKQINKDLNNQVALLRDQVFNLEDQVFNLDTDAKSAAEKQKSLLEQVAFCKDVIRREGINEQEAMKKAEPPPLVYGRVIDTKAADRTGPEYVEISLGSDDGLAEGHKLHVFSTKERGKYLGEILLVHVVHDGAVGKVLLKSKNGVIQRGDNVTTKL
jgi:hypothetical protein